MARSASSMSYLSRFWTFLQITFPKLDRISKNVSRGERISRFVFYNGHFDEKNGRIDFAAFLPPKKAKDISVFRTMNCGERKVWLLGDLFVARTRKDKRGILARGDVESDLVFDDGLAIVAMPTPHPRHALIADWPDEKSLRKIKAMTLAQRSTLHVHPRRDVPKARSLN